jgi:hypothetical protein
MTSTPRNQTPTLATIAGLLTRGNGQTVSEKTIDTGWACGGDAGGHPLQLACGVVHEFLGAAAGEKNSAGTFPLAILAHLAGASLPDEPQPAGVKKHAEHRRVIWVGKAIWPRPEWLAPHLLEHSLWVAFPRHEPAQRLWAADLLLRCKAFAAVLVDASGFDIAATKRLQLASRVGLGLCVLARPPNEANILSAAASRWRVETVLSPSPLPRWNVTLLRNKNEAVRMHGRAVDLTAPIRFTLESHRVSRGLRVPAPLVNQPAATAPAASGVSGRRYTA